MTRERGSCPFYGFSHSVGCARYSSGMSLSHKSSYGSWPTYSDGQGPLLASERPNRWILFVLEWLSKSLHFASKWVKQSLREFKFLSSVMRSLWSEERSNGIRFGFDICCKGSSQSLKSDRTLTICERRSVADESIFWQILFLTESSIVWGQLMFLDKLSVVHSLIETPLASLKLVL